MVNLTTRSSRILCRTLAFVLANAAIPFGIPKLVSDAWPRFKPAPVKAQPKASRPLSGKEMRTLQGKSGANPYLSGQNKWDVQFKGVNLMTGNYSMSATDLDFEAGYGIPVNVTRSYSANCPDEGPFGIGWTLSADVRSTAGGLLKGPSAPNRAVPTNVSEQPVKEYDPNAASPSGNHAETGTGAVGKEAQTSPIQGVTVTDAGGTAETIQKDVDGVLTTPPWDDNVSNAVYQFVVFGGSVYQILLSNTTTTIDGTSYVYAAEGNYPSGKLPYNSAQQTPTPTATPANVLKVTSATDRQGNVTHYYYGTTAVSFVKSDGTTSEFPLTSVHMPNGHTITFTWGNGTTAPTNRIYTVSDGTGTGSRTVTYGYGNPSGTYITGEGSALTSVTTPQGKQTTYAYGAPYVPSGWSSSGYDSGGGLLTSITDPRGLVTGIHYEMGFPTLLPYGIQLAGVIAYRIDDPNGVRSYIQDGANTLPGGDDPGFSDFPAAAGSSALVQLKGGSGPSGSVFNSGYVFSVAGGTSSVPTLTFTMVDGFIHSSHTGWGTVNRWQKVYNVINETLTSDDECTNPGSYDFSGVWLAGFVNPHGLAAPTWFTQDVITTKAYNFMGNPLSSIVQESYVDSGGTGHTTRTAEVDYGYWNATKYYQQKATKDQAGRFTFTDYFTNTASAGSRGQTYEVFSPAFATFDNTGTNWQNLIVPHTGAIYSAQFAYDSNGRATDVYKLQTSAPAYVHTHTTYTSDGTPAWGEAGTVVEDYGGIARTTTTNGYTTDGKADDVTDAAGHRFVTSYDLDGVVQSVTRTDVLPNVALVTYVYGTSGVTNGMPGTITDGLSGVIQNITYDSTSTDGGYGQVSEVKETNGTDIYTSDYVYDAAGNRQKATYTTPAQTNRWQYDDYNRVGTPENPKFAFQTLTKLDSGSNLTSEAMHYYYDSQGRLEDSAFAQTPYGGFVPTGSNPWYDSTHPASSRARAFYTYDSAGRVSELDHWWDTWNTGTSSWNASVYVLGNSCAYETSGAYNRGVKTSDTYLNNNSSLNWTQTYGYDNNLDYLTSANYADGQPHASQTWTYDAAGNRKTDYTGTGWTYDNLNRMTANGAGTSETNDILGNRTGLGSTVSYGWDALNRMISYNGGTATSYAYRADGMRVSRTQGTSTDRFRYDGQMPMETVQALGTAQTIENGLGARGIDWTSVTTGSGTTYSFPLYDAHGNQVATLARGSGSTYSLGNQRSFGAWGEIRQGATSGSPNGRYCGNLGHVQDDESGLIYMRARNYEPASGRFISQDTARSGWNWFNFCGNDSINRADSDGRFWWFFVGLIVMGAIMGMATYAVFQYTSGAPITAGGLLGAAAFGALTGAIAAVGGAFAAGAIASAAAAYDFMIAAFAIRLGILGLAGVAGAIKGNLSRPSGLGLALAGIYGEQILLLGMMDDMNNG